MQAMNDPVQRRRFEAANGKLVDIRVLKAGHERIATGELDAASGYALFHVKGDVVHGVPQATADKYEDTGWAEIVEDAVGVIEPQVDGVEFTEARRGPGRPRKVDA